VDHYRRSDVPDDVVVLADRRPQLVQAESVVPLYRRNELAERQVLAINDVADAWLAEHPLGAVSPKLRSVS
jgi:hypothetical protein